jgi:error-prone DNA polymerase
MSFVHLHCHSSFSFHAGVPSVPEFVGRAKDLGMPAVGLTDTDRMSGLILHYEECRRHGIQPILGAELTEPRAGEILAAQARRAAGDDLPLDRIGVSKIGVSKIGDRKIGDSKIGIRKIGDRRTGGPLTGSHGGDPSAQAPRADGAGSYGRERLVLLARNAQGYADLCDILTERHLAADTFRFDTVFDRPWPDLVLITSSPGLLGVLAATPNRPNLYAELVNHSAATRRRSRQIEAVATALQVPLVATNDSYFLERPDWHTHQVLTAIGLNSTASRLRPEECAAPGATLRTAQEMAAAFPSHPQALANAERIAQDCGSIELDLGHWIMPRIEVPGGATPEDHLAQLAWAGLERHYGGRPEYTRARQIQQMELETIEKLGYPSYFLIVREIRDWANSRFATGYRRPADCTILRGSAANSLTFYNIGVSDLDPIRYDLYFQRFLNEDRASPPDADLDFGWDERDEVQKFIARRWGQERVAVTCTTNHFRERAAFRETAKVYGYTDDQVSQILDSHKSRTQRIEDDELRRIWQVAGTVRGKPRFLGQHPGGVLITNQPMRRHVACERSGGQTDRIITQVDMHNGIDELGLIKFDILGNGSLSVLRDALAQLADQGEDDPEVFDLEKCYADPEVKDVIRKGRTKGIFYIESPAQTRLNKKAQAETFEEITITSSLVRPAGSKYTATFVERERQRKQGTKDWEFLHPALEPILHETHDVCAFQEDVTKICHQVAGLSYAQADRIRKMMNSQHEGAPAQAIWQETASAFLQGCMQHSGLTREQADEVWERVSSFTGFSFCKSHSATYAQLSFQCTYLKAHYPAQFLSAVISNSHGFYRRDVYLNEARRCGCRILPMDINDSRVKYTGRDRLIRPGFMHVRSVRASTLQGVEAGRGTDGPFRDLVDFVERTSGNAHKAEIERLILVGAFDGFGLSQPESLWLLDDVCQHLGVRNLKGDDADAGGSGSLFQGTGVLEGMARDVPRGLLSNYNLAQRCLNELQLLGYMLSGDILEILDLHPASRGAVPMRDVAQHRGKSVKVFGRQVTERMHRVQRTGEPMMFLTLEDKSETVDVILWPDVFERHADVVLGGGPFEVQGRIEEDWGTFSLVAERIRAVEWSPNVVDLELASARLEQSFGDGYAYGDVAVGAAA